MAALPPTGSLEQDTPPSEAQPGFDQKLSADPDQDELLSVLQQLSDIGIEVDMDDDEELEENTPVSLEEAASMATESSIGVSLQGPDDDEGEAAGERRGQTMFDLDEDVYQRKCSVIMQLIQSGPELDIKIAEFKDEIDEDMLNLLAARIELSQQADRDGLTSQKLEELYRILKLVHQVGQGGGRGYR